MEKAKEGIDEIAREIEKLIESNKKFLSKMMDEDFEDEDEVDKEEPEKERTEDFEEL